MAPGSHIPLRSRMTPSTSVTSGSLLLSCQFQHLEVPPWICPPWGWAGTVLSGLGFHHGQLGDFALLKIWDL